MTLLRLNLRMVRRSTVVMLYLSGAITAIGAHTYPSFYPTAASRATLDTLIGSNRAFAALQGQAVGLDTAGGFVVWKYGGTLVVLIALWAMLTTTRLLRGDEELGRADLLVAAPTRVSGLLLGQLGVLAGAVALVGLAAAVGGAVTGLPLRGCVLFGLMMASCGWVFGAVAAVTSQLLPTRRQASGAAGALLGAAFLLRAVATGTGRDWLCWLTPFGWADRLSPFSDPRYVAVVPIALAPVAFGAAALWCRARRDTGAGMWERHDLAAVRSRSTRSVLALDWRLTRGTTLGWGLGATVAGFVLGFLAIGVADYARSDSGINAQITKYTGSSVATVTGFLGLSFSVVAIILAIFAGTLIARAREEEGQGRADTLLATGTSRWRYVGSRVVLALAFVVVLALLAGLATWAGTAVSGHAASLGGMVQGSLNTVPLALLFGAVTLLAFGVFPRATTAVAFGSVGVAYGIQVIGGSVSAPQWVLDLSPFTHLAPVPAVPVDATPIVVMLALALALALAGTVAFARRDTQPA